MSVIRGITGEECHDVLHFSDSESLFLLTPDGAKVEISDLEKHPLVVLYLRSDFSSEISHHPNFRLCLGALGSFLGRRRAAFVSAIAGFSAAVLVHSEKTADCLAGLDASLASLEKIELHPALVADDRKNLLDVVPQLRIAEFRTQLSKQVADLLAKVHSWKLDALSLCENLHIISASLLHASDSIVPRPTANISSEYTGPFLLANKLIKEFGVIMTKVRKSETAGVLLEEAFARSRKSLGQLEHLEKMPTAYEKSLAEIVRRKIFKAKYLARMEAMRLELAAVQGEENERRKKFFNKYAVHLPLGLVPGLGDVAASVAVQVTADFDCDLPLVLGTSSQMSASSLEPLAYSLKASKRFLPSE